MNYEKGVNEREDSQRSLWRNWYIAVLGLRFGYQWAPLLIDGFRYMDRHILYLGWINLRLHKFYRGDDDSASHTHPWWFITLPFTSYIERRYRYGVPKGLEVVKAWRFHFRSASHEHIVLGRALGNGRYDWLNLRPFWTFVIAGSRSMTWGFYPEPHKFVPWWEYKPGTRT